MFYFLTRPITNANLVLIAAAVIPAIFLMVKVYKSDRLEKESPGMLLRLVTAGILSSLLALVEERIAETLLNFVLDSSMLLYNIILYFVIVAGAEESSKYLFLKRRTWNSPEFNCRYDGVVYAVFVSLGFALWENISYVITYGFSTALVRAVTAIPGHACFGVFMGIFYSMAKQFDYRGNKAASKLLRLFSFLFPALLHGTYDFIATLESQQGSWYFVLFVGILFLTSFLLVSKTAKKDKYINR